MRVCFGDLRCQPSGQDDTRVYHHTGPESDTTLASDDLNIL